MQVVWDASWLCLYLLWFAMNGSSTHSCYAWIKDGESIGDVCGFDREIFYRFISHHFVELGVGGVAGHGLSFACCDCGKDLMLGETFVALANDLDHCHGLLGAHVDVRETATYAVFLLVEGDLFAMRSGENPILANVVADCESVCY